MARKRKHPREVRTHQIIAKVTEGEHKRVAREARRLKLTNSEYLRQALGLA